MSARQRATTRQCAGCARQVRDGYLCGACTRELAGHYAALPALVRELITTAYRQDRLVVPGTGTGRSGSRPLPFRDAASRLLVSVGRHLGAICERQGVAWRRGGQMVPVAELCRQLAAQARQQAAQDERAGDDLATLAADIEAISAMIDLPATHRYLGRCDACGVEMYAERAAGRHECVTRGCGAAYDVPARVADLLDRSRAVVATATMIATALTSLDQPVTEERIKKWRQRGRLAVVGYVGSATGSGKPRPTFRVGDVIDLLDRETRQARSKRAAGQ